MLPELLVAAGFTQAPPQHPVVFADLAGRRCRFMMDFGAIRDLEISRGATLEAILSRFAGFSLAADDVCEIIRLALIGGGEASPRVAESVVEIYVRPRLGDHRHLAERLLTAVFSGLDPSPDQPGEASGTGESPAI